MVVLRYFSWPHRSLKVTNLSDWLTTCAGHVVDSRTHSDCLPVIDVRGCNKQCRKNNAEFGRHHMFCRAVNSVYMSPTCCQVWFRELAVEVPILSMSTWGLAFTGSSACLAWTCCPGERPSHPACSPVGEKPIISSKKDKSQNEYECVWKALRRDSSLESSCAILLVLPLAASCEKLNTWSTHSRCTGRASCKHVRTFPVIWHRVPWPVPGPFHHPTHLWWELQPMSTSRYPHCRWPETTSCRSCELGSTPAAQCSCCAGLLPSHCHCNILHLSFDPIVAEII